ncbi:AlkA N-terminal domain-containing protein [Streptomyces sp. NPDC020192]|uniref:AlkA N-terminal domain-containing protein n=1 Tax=Streptomyces sp. NPDC020192 TaxID=3365066 RepID=UPI00378A242F
MPAFLAERAVPGVESVEADVYRRTISLDGEAGLLEVRAGRIFGVDADTAPAETALAAVLRQCADQPQARAVGRPAPEPRRRLSGHRSPGRDRRRMAPLARLRRDPPGPGGTPHAHALTTSSPQPTPKEPTDEHRPA